MTAALLNGLWQGALIAGIAWLATRLVPARAAATRYALWYAALAALAIVPVVTFWRPFGAIPALPSSIVHASSAASNATMTAAGASGAWLVSLWLVGTLACLTRLAMSYWRIRRVMASATPRPELGPEVVSSSDVRIPISTGLVRPSIVIPADVLATLDLDELRDIVEHERAHIRRRDVLGNLIQRIVEACLFFNPWVYVIGSNLVREREAACDDWVAYLVGEPGRYAACLARVAQGALGSKAPLLTPSAIGSKHLVVDRIARLLDGKDIHVKTNRSVLAAGIAAFVFLGAGIAGSNPGLASPSPNPNLPANCNHDAVVAQAAMPNIAKADYKANVTANALVTVGSDGRPVTAKIVNSSGSAAIDRATVDAAMRSTYKPALSNCKPVTGQYLFHVATAP